MSVSHEPVLRHEVKVLGAGAKLELLVGERPLRHQRQHLAPEDDAVALRLRAVRMDEFQSPGSCELSHQLQQLIQGSDICCYQGQVISIADSRQQAHDLCVTMLPGRLCVSENKTPIWNFWGRNRTF